MTLQSPPQQVPEEPQTIAQPGVNEH